MGYLLSKVLPLAVLPLGLAMVLMGAGLLGRRRWPLAGALAVLGLFSTGVVAQVLWRSVETPWERRTVDSAPMAAAIVVLSGGRHAAPGADRVSEWHDPDRFLSGVALFKAGRAPRLLFTGGQSPHQRGLPPEGQLYLAEAQAMGIPAAAMATTTTVVNTAEEARAVRALVPGSNRRILLVTSAFHMRRAQRLFERQGLLVEPFPVDFQARGRWAGSIVRDPLMWLPSAGHLDASSRALREWIGRLVYRAW
ncbi:MAG: YdcF family protein [Synechococcus sp.]